MFHSDLSSEDLKLLSALEHSPSLSALGEYFGRDKSVISRKLKALSQRSSSIEKVGSQWRLTEVGKRLTKLALDFDIEQKQILEQPTLLKIAGTRLFVSHVLATHAGELQKIFPKRTLSFLSYEGTPERLLIDGMCDLAFACGKPSDPSIAFRRSIQEPFYAVATPKFLKRFRVKDFPSLQKTPHIAFCHSNGHLPFSQFLDAGTPIALRLNDPMGVLKAVEADWGWSVLPYYAVEKSAVRGKLHIFPDGFKEVERYGIWWLRSRASQAPTAEKAHSWLAQQRLGPDSH